MRVFGRIIIGTDPVTGVVVKQWVQVNTDPNGDNDHVMLTALARLPDYTELLTRAAFLPWLIAC